MHKFIIQEKHEQFWCLNVHSQNASIRKYIEKLLGSTWHAQIIIIIVLK